MHRRTRTATAVVGAATLFGLATGPALAAGPVAQAEARALTITLAGQAADTGSYRSSHDGDRETTEGSNTPQLGLLGGQQLIQAGTLAQDARTNADSISRACAGLAGEGATVVGVGDEISCFAAGDTVRLSLGSLDLRDLEPITGDQLPEEITGPLGQLTGALDPLLDALNDAAEQAGAEDAGIFLEADAIESRCRAEADTASGTSLLENARIVGRFDETEVTLLDLETRPDPDTDVVATPSALTTLIREALQRNFEDTLGGQLGQIGEALGGLEQLDGPLDQIAEQLAPVTGELLRLRLNVQERPTADSIAVTALDLGVAPAAAEQLGGDLVGVQIGQVACGPSNVADEPETTEPRTPPAPPELPRKVPAGADVATDDGLTPGSGLVGLLVVGTALAIGVRRAH